MREMRKEAIATPPPESNVTTMLLTRVEEAPEGVAFERQYQPGVWTRVSVTQFHAEVVALAKGLIAIGVRPGDVVAIMSRTRWEWPLIDFAIWFAGAVSVPIYETSSRDQIRWIVGDAGVSFAFAETAEYAQALAAAAKKTAGLKHVAIIDDGGIANLVRAGSDVSDAQVEARRSAAGQDDLATIIYTSGTTGRPKGVELTHGNFCSLTANIRPPLNAVLSTKPETRTLLFIPMAHVFARMIQIICVPAGVVVGHSPDVKNLMPDMESFGPTFLLAVPRVFEKVYNSAEQKAASSGSFQLKMFRLGAKIAVAYSRTRDADGPNLWLSLRHRFFDMLVFRKLRAAMGGKVVYAVSGGAPLGERLGHFFRGIGLTVLEGYGLTESSAPTAVNLPEFVEIGTVGPPIPGASVRIADDGEVLLNGPHIFRAYHNNPVATAEALHDGWFHTGDLGDLDDHGYLRITGRKKEIIVTAGGKNVQPAILEDRLRSHPLIGQCLVVGDKRPFVGALITLDAEMLPTWLVNHGKPVLTSEQATTDPDVIASLDRAVARANRAVSRAESIRKYTILPVDFTVENGYLTPSLKMRRDVVLHDYADTIDELYGGPVEEAEQSVKASPPVTSRNGGTRP